MRALLAALLLAGCAPSPANGQLACGAKRECPPDYYCAVDDSCWRVDVGPDLSMTDLGSLQDLAASSNDLAGESLFLDLTVSPLPAVLKASRSGGTLYLATGSATASANAPGVTPPFEDRGQPGGGGVWSFASYSNVVPTPFSFAGFNQTNSGTVTDGDGPAPDATLTAARIADTDASNLFQVYDSITATGVLAVSLWVKDAAPAPSSPGMVSHNGTRLNGVSLGSGAAWRRVRYFDPNGGTAFTIDAAGAQPGPAISVSDTGAVQVWGAQSLVSGVDVPLVDGTATDQVLQLDAAALAKLVTGGDFEAEIAFRQDARDILSVRSGYVFSADGPDGLLALQYAAATQTWTLTARGAPVLTTTMGVGLFAGETTVHVTFRPSINSSSIRIALNGAAEHTQIATGTAGGGALATPTAFYLGSNLGVSGFWPARFTRFAAWSQPPPAWAPEGLVLGDAIMSWTTLATASGPLTNEILASSLIYTVPQSRSRAGIVSLAQELHKCEDQQAAFSASPYAGSSSLKWVLIQCGIDNVGVGLQSANTATAKLQSLIDTVRASNPSVKIIVGQMLPAKAYLDQIAPDRYLAWQTMNASIAAGMANADATVTANEAALDNGSGSIKNGLTVDGVHPNTAGRVIFMPAYVTALSSLGLLQ